MSAENIDPVHGGEAERWGGWSWRDPSHGEHYRTCSYCGSIHPEDLAAESDWRAEWADRKYGWPHKFYIAVANRHPEQRFLTASTNATRPPDLPNAEWIRGSDIPGDVNTEGHGDLSELWVQLGTRATHHAKFYTAHLADPNVGQEALETVQRVSGLRFTFQGGRIAWEPAT